MFAKRLRKFYAMRKVASSKKVACNCSPMASGLCGEKFVKRLL